jgi:hypothetical protein
MLVVSPLSESPYLLISSYDIGSKRFGNRLKRFRALIVALNVSLFLTVAEAQQTSTTDRAPSSPAKPAQLPSPTSALHRIQAVRVTDTIKIDGLLDEAAWSLALVDLSESYNRVRLREGNFSTSLFSGRLNYNFSRKLLTSALIQLNSAARLSVINVRLRYIYRPNSDFFIIYNQSTEAGLERPSYSLQIKLTRDFPF